MEYPHGCDPIAAGVMEALGKLVWYLEGSAQCFWPVPEVGRYH